MGIHNSNQAVSKKKKKKEINKVQEYSSVFICSYRFWWAEWSKCHCLVSFGNGLLNSILITKSLANSIFSLWTFLFLTNNSHSMLWLPSLPYICNRHYLPSHLIHYLNLENHYFREEKVGSGKIWDKLPQDMTNQILYLVTSHYST